MASYAGPIKKAIQGTIIALATWLVLHFAKEYLGRTAALTLAAVIFLLFVFVFWSRLRLRSGNGLGPPSR